MNILVTGACGFLGHHLVARLRRDAHNVIGIDDLSANCITPTDRDLKCSIHAVDSLQDHFGEFDVVFHTAAISRTVPAIEDPKTCNRTNVDGSLNIFRSFPNARIVHSSSNVVYAKPNPYQASKVAAEQYALACNEVYNSRIICLRYSNLIGPGYRIGDPAVLASLRECRAANGYVEVTGDGKQTRNFLYVDDAVEANLKAMNSIHNGVLDVTTGVVTSMNEFAGYFNCPIKYIGDRLGDTKHIHQEAADARKILGWQAQVPFDEAMKRSLA